MRILTLYLHHQVTNRTYKKSEIFSLCEVRYINPQVRNLNFNNLPFTKPKLNLNFNNLNFYIFNIMLGHSSDKACPVLHHTKSVFDTDTYNYIELCHFFQIIIDVNASVSVSCLVFMSLSVLHK